MDDIQIKPISWLWPHRIARGKLTVIAGNPGLGKSQLTANLAAIISSGKSWPDTQDRVPIGSVVFLSAEDDPADTIKPRLMAAGADTKKIHVLEAIYAKNDTGKESERTFDLGQDIERLSMTLDKLNDVSLVIIDPITAYLGNVDSHNNADIRGILAPLSAMAAKHNAAILLITHLNKSTGQDVMARVIGSIGLIAAARAGYAVIKESKMPEIRYFIPIKNNVGNDQNGFSFVIEEVAVEGDILTSRIVWQDGLIDAQSILTPPIESKPTATNAAAEWLAALLTGKVMLASDIYAEGEGAGFSKSCIQRAAVRIGVIKTKAGFKNGPWEWSLAVPRGAAKAHEDDEEHIC